LFSFAILDLFEINLLFLAKKSRVEVYNNYYNKIVINTIYILIQLLVAQISKIVAYNFDFCTKNY